MSRLLVAVVIGLAVLAPPAALADGGPAPGIAVGFDGVESPSGAARWVTVPARSSTAVLMIATDGGRVVRYRPLPGMYGVPLVAFDGTTGGLSADGRTLVLAGPGWPNTKFVFLDPMTLRTRERITLRGAFSFDALSPDGETMYLIQLVAPGRSGRYLVRAYDVERGLLLEKVIRDPRDKERTMHGYPIARATSSDGIWVYTLYTSDEGHVFVHALDTVGRRARCIDLPWHGAQAGSWNLRLGLTDDGKRVLASDDGGEVFATIDTATFEVREPASGTGAAPRGVRAAAPRAHPQRTAIGGALGSAVLAFAGLAIVARRNIRARR